MAAGNSVSAPERTLVTTRIYDAPREAVYKAWVDPKQLARWFPPEGFTSPRCEIDARPGGSFSIGLRPADRSQEGFELGGTYREVKRPERLVQVIGDGRVMTTTLDEVLGGTKLTLSLEMAAGMTEAQERGGWTQILDHLATHVATLS